MKQFKYIISFLDATLLPLFSCSFFRVEKQNKTKQLRIKKLHNNRLLNVYKINNILIAVLILHLRYERNGLLCLFVF